MLEILPFPHGVSFEIYSVRCPKPCGTIAEFSLGAPLQTHGGNMCYEEMLYRNLVWEASQDI